MGEDLINGTNKDYGGFKFSGHITVSDSFPENTVHVIGTYEIHDFMDVNEKYSTDVALRAIVGLFEWGAGVDCEMEISGEIDFYMEVSPYLMGN